MSKKWMAWLLAVAVLLPVALVPAQAWAGGGGGYRGGGYYERGTADTALNPHSRVEQRPYGSWGGGPRGVAYGFRAARTADQ